MMFLNVNNIPQKLVQLVLSEKALLTKLEELESEMETALNLCNDERVSEIEAEGNKLEKKAHTIFLEKAVVMTMATQLNPKFKLN